MNRQSGSDELAGVEMRMKFEAVYRQGKRLFKSSHRLIAKIIKILCRIYFHCDIPYEAEIDEDVYFCHNAFSVVINPNVIVGDRDSTWCNNWRNR